MTNLLTKSQLVINLHREDTALTIAELCRKVGCTTSVAYKLRSEGKINPPRTKEEGAAIRTARSVKVTAIQMAKDAATSVAPTSVVEAPVEVVAAIPKLVATMPDLIREMQRAEDRRRQKKLDLASLPTMHPRPEIHLSLSASESLLIDSWLEATDERGRRITFAAFCEKRFVTHARMRDIIHRAKAIGDDRTARLDVLDRLQVA